MDRFMAPHPTFKVSSFYPSKAETKARSVEDATFCAPPESKGFDAFLNARHRSWCRDKPHGE